MQNNDSLAREISVEGFKRSVNATVVREGKRYAKRK